jgi:hypothetical protein
LHQVGFGTADDLFVVKVYSSTIGLSIVAFDREALDLILFGDLQHFVLVGLVEHGHFDSYRSSHCSADVFRRRSDETEMVILAEMHFLVNDLGSLAKTLKGVSDQSLRVHRNDGQLVLIIHPEEEGLCMVIEITSAFRPVTLQPRVSQSWIIILVQPPFTSVFSFHPIGHVF